MTVYLSLEQLSFLHERQLRAFGGQPGLRDRPGLQSATARPAMTFGDEDLVETTMAVARGEVTAEALAIWIRQRTVEEER